MHLSEEDAQNQNVTERIKPSAGKPGDNKEASDSEDLEPSNFEDLDMLCDGVEADQIADKRKQLIKDMNKKMDDKLNLIKEQKQMKKEMQMEKSASTSKDIRSGILLRDGTRVATEDEILARSNKRDFIEIEKIDQLEVRSKYATLSQSHGMFTIGILTDKSPPINSKIGKKFMVFKISDLVKYDIDRVRTYLQEKFGKGENMDEMKITMKSFTPSGYKNISFMAFGDSQLQIQNVRAGTILAIISPKLMKANADYGVSFSVDSEAQILMIGYSQDYSLCKGKSATSSVVNGMMNQVFACRSFLNKSVETLCERHR